MAVGSLGFSLCSITEIRSVLQARQRTRPSSVSRARQVGFPCDRRQSTKKLTGFLKALPIEEAGFVSKLSITVTAVIIN